MRRPARKRKRLERSSCELDFQRVAGRVAIAVTTAAIAASAAPPSASPERARVPLVPCHAAIAQEDSLSSPVNRLVLGRVGLPKESFVVQLDPPFGKPQFAKHGLEVRAGTPIMIAVPRAYRRVYGLHFHSSAKAPSVLGYTVMRVQPCVGGGAPRWTVWSGGYVLRRPACVPLIVHADGRTARVRLSIGTRCR